MNLGKKPLPLVGWTKDPPTEPGWYWVHHCGGIRFSEIVEVERSYGALVIEVYNQYDLDLIPVKEYGSKPVWYGPIQPPDLNDYAWYGPLPQPPL